MVGFCPNGSGPPACYPGPKWTPNDPLFFLHHAVRFTPTACFISSRSSHHMIVQMVDKVWHDWQQKGLRNKYSFGGGSVSTIFNSTFATFTEFPTGLPPYVNVSVPSDLRYVSVIVKSDPLRSPPLSLTPRSLVTVYGTPKSGT